MEGGEIDHKIEQSDIFKERIHVAIIKSNKALEAKRKSRILATTVPPSSEMDSDSPAVVTSSEPSTDAVASEASNVVVTSSEMSSDTVTSEVAVSVVSTSVNPVSMVTPLITSPNIATTTTIFGVAATESVSTPVAPLMFLPSVSMVLIHPHLPLMGSSNMSITPTQTMASTASVFGTPASSMVGHATRVKLPKLVPK